MEGVIAKCEYAIVQENNKVYSLSRISTNTTINIASYYSPSNLIAF
jgi:hypothetical protein